jgi:alkylhydroperoxidase/carboxymuconolactone decarboxylase family protein YurZ
MLMIDFPTEYRDIEQKYPEIARTHHHMADLCHAAGPLDEKTRRLVKLAAAIGVGVKGAIKSHTRRAVKIGIEADELRHTAILTATTVGFPSMVSSLRWIEEVLLEKDTENDYED